MAEEGGLSDVIEFVKDNYGAEIIKLNTESDEKEGVNLDPAKHGAVVALPTGMSLVDLSPFLAKLLARPKHIEANAMMFSADSMIDYIVHFAEENKSALFLDPNTRALRCVIDFHENQATPAFGKHTVTYNFPVSEQFRDWTENSKNPLSNEGMATFLLDRQYDIVNPPADWMQLEAAEVDRMKGMLNLVDDYGPIDDNAGEPLDPSMNDPVIPRSALYKLRKIRFANAARLVQIARTVEISVSAEVKSAYDPQTGARTLHFQEASNIKASSDGRKVTLPEMFLINVPLFVGAAPQTLPIRLIYRLQNQAVKWWFLPVEWQRLMREAVLAESKRIAEATNVPLFQGVPHR